MNKEMKRRNKNMDKEEYYNRIEKINNRFKTDRVSADEEYQLVCQRNYLSTKYIEHLEQENKQLKDNWNKLKEYISKNIIYDDVGMKILDPSPLEDYIAELEQGSDSNGQ